MTEVVSALEYLRDARIALHATSALPAWLFTVDGTSILWANPPGAALLDNASPATIALQVSQLASGIPPDAPARLARLRGFGVGFGKVVTCACVRLTLADRRSAILIAAIESVGIQMPLDERLRRLLADSNDAVALFSPRGQVLHATPAGATRLAGATSLADLGVDALAGEALATGHARARDFSIERLGADETLALMATFSPPAAARAQAPATPQTMASTAPPEHPIPPNATPDRSPPLRFMWQMDEHSRFSLGSDEFSTAIGPRTATALGRPWPEIAKALNLDSAGVIARAIANRETWSGVALAWPVDGSAQTIAVEMSGFPLFGRERRFEGYRGFGLCRDAARLSELAHARRTGAFIPAAPPEAPLATPQQEERPAAQAAPPSPPPQPPSAEIPPPPAAPEPPAPTEERPAAASAPPAQREERPALTVVPRSKTVVPFPAATPPPGLSAIERRAFHEIARELTSRLGIAGIKTPPITGTETPPPEPTAPAEPWIAAPTPPAAPAEAGILDRLPVGVLIYRGNQLIHANRALLDWTGYADLDELAQAGGLERLFAQPDLDVLPETRTLAITTSSGEQLPVEGRLFTVPWDGESAIALVLMLAAADDRQKMAELKLRSAEAETRDMVAILDTATDGVIVLDAEGHLLSGNRSAEALFGYDTHELTTLTFIDLFAPESQRIALDYLDGLVRAGVASVLNDGREVIGRVREGGLIPLFMTMGRIGEGGEKFCAVFRDITQWKKAEEELLNAKQTAEKTSSAKSEFLAKISHEIRTPLNSIIGFSEVMAEERFGPIGNERYRQYLKDIHSSGAHVVSLLNDLLDLSKIEAGKLELNFARVDLNAEVQQCVALMQPQANRERIIIRTSLAPKLPPVVADARSVRQIVLNLLSNSIKFTGAGGQVIVSTTRSDAGEVILRVRDSGQGMTEQDIAIALEPFRQLATSARWGSGGTGLGLPLTKALAEANRANFSITSKPNTGTLVEISFPATRVLAE